MSEQSDPSAKEHDRTGSPDNDRPAREPEPAPASGKGEDRHPEREPEPASGKGEDLRPERERRSASASGQDDVERVTLAGIASLERLRDRVEVAAHEMKRLREENRALAERIKELEARPAVDPHGTFLSLDHDPDLLRRKITGFIEAIDHYLERERKST